MIVVSMESSGIGDAILCSAVVSGLVKVHGPRVLYHVKPNVIKWLKLYKDAPCSLVLPPSITQHYYPYRGYGRELLEHGSKGRLWYYASECGGVEAIKPTWTVPQQAVDGAEADRGAVMLFPFADGQNRSWQLSSWLALERLLKKAGLRTIISARLGSMRLTSPFQGKRMMGQTPERVAGLMKVSRCVVGNDSMGCTLAGALDVPALSLCGPTDGPSVYGFWPSVKTIQGPLPCNGCYFHGEAFLEKCNRSCDALAMIRPEEVFQSILNLPTHPAKNTTVNLPLVSGC